MRNDERGQATVEFVVLAVALMAVATGLSVLANAVSQGGLVDSASRNAAYSIEDPGMAARYVLLF